MKYIRVITCALAITVFVVVPAVVRAQDATAVRYQTISRQCGELQAHVERLQRRDLVSRTNVGREYENVSKQLNAFNQRLRNNDINAQPFEQLTTQFTNATNQFRQAYVEYDDSLIKLQQINCQDHPADFNAQLITARGLRDATMGAITRANSIIGLYRTAASQLPVPAATEESAP